MSDQPKVYSEDEVKEKLEKELPDWYLEGRWIRRQYKTDGWQATLMLVNTIGYIAEAAYHHPDLEVGYGYCRMTYNTHAIGGLSQNDFICAAKVDALPHS